MFMTCYLWNVHIFVCILCLSVKCFYCCLHLDAGGLISVTSVQRLELSVQVTTLSAVSAIFHSTTIVDLTLGVYGPKTVSIL